MSLFVNFCREMIQESEKEICHFRVRAVDSIAFLTYRCTSQCRTCNIWKRCSNPSEELNVQQWENVIDRMARYGIRSFEVFGGDALLRKDAIFRIVQRCRERGIETYFPTNALLCDRETIRNLIDAGLGTVYLSIDDVEEDHDQLRGKDGTFRRVCQALEDFSDLRGSREKPCIVVCTTLSRMNFRNFPRLVKFLEKYPINAIYPRPLGEFTQENIRNSLVDGIPPDPYFAPSDGQSHLMNPKEMGEMRDVFRTMRRMPGKVYINWRSYYATSDATFLKGEYPLRHCHIASTLPTVNPNGDVIPCPFFRDYVIGNLSRQGLEEIWGGVKHRKFLKYQKSGKIAICRNCNTRVYYPSMNESLAYYFRRALEMTGLVRT
jgi:radical SAM protein with 4Fe4S-binding SPASM domain